MHRWDFRKKIWYRTGVVATKGLSPTIASSFDVESYKPRKSLRLMILISIIELDKVELEH